jgi:predicted ATPase
MKYTKFIIKNYKGIQNLTLDLEKQPLSKIITLVGLNESGKTSILEAINLIQQDLALSDTHKLKPKKDKLNFSGMVKVTGEMLLNEEDNILLSRKVRDMGFGTIKPITRLSITKEYVFKNSKYISNIRRWTANLSLKELGANKFRTLKPKDAEWLPIILCIKNELIPKILYYPDFLFDFPNKIYLDQTTSVNKKQTQFRDVIQDILTSISKELTIEDHLISRLKDKSEADMEALEHTLSKMSAKISTVVLGAWNNIMNISGKEIFVEAKSETNKVAKETAEGQVVTEEREIYYLEFRLKDGTDRYYIAERSLGFKWFFTFLLFTEFRKNRKTDIGETLFLLDEPASNLHSTAQKKLLSKFDDLVTKGRLIYTTHSHHLINPKLLEGTYIVKNAAVDYKNDIDFDNTNTNIEAIPYKQFVASNPNQQDYFQPVLDALDYQPGLLEKIDDIVITEGKFDYYILRYINEVVLSNKYPLLRFYPSNGADSNFQVIRLYLAWGRGFKILLDGDGAGVSARKRYLKEFDSSLEDRVVTFLNIDEAFNFAIEGLFNEDEKILVSQKFDSHATVFSKAYFNTGIQSLFINKEKIELSQSTIQKFEKLFEFLLRS